MNLGWNKRWMPLVTDGVFVASGQALKGAVIAGVISSCSTMDQTFDSDPDDPASLTTSEELPPAPEIEQLAGAKRASFDEFLTSQGYENVQFVALAYSEDGQETLVVLQFYEVETTDPPVDENDFLIPPVGKRFDEAVVIYSGSPARTTTCGRSSGGTRYCNF
jgi:hypothetical protein